MSHGKTNVARSPRAGVVVIERVQGLLWCKVLRLALELCLSGLQVHLLSMQVVRLLLKVGHTATGTLVQRHEPRRLLSKIVIVDVVAHVRWGIIVNVVGVILQSIP